MDPVWKYAMLGLSLLAIGGTSFGALQTSRLGDSEIRLSKTAADLTLMTAAKTELAIRLATTQASARDQSEALAAERDRAVAAEQVTTALMLKIAKDRGTKRDAPTADVLRRFEKSSLMAPATGRAS